jgi:DNA-binding CsgD family transcriptional regulator
MRAPSQRELEVVKLIADGLDTKAIGQVLGISHNTVRAHRRRIYACLQVNSIALVVRWAYENGEINDRPSA